MLKIILKLLHYEIIACIRQSREWLYPLSFFVIIMSFFPLAFSPDKTFLMTYFSGCVWIAAMLASLLSVQTFFVSDLEDGYLEQLILSDIPLAFLFFIKLVSQWLFTQLPLIILTPLFGFLFNVPFNISLQTAFTLLLGTPIILLLGCTSAALTLGLRQQAILLALLIMPLAVPVLIFGVNIIQQAQAGFNIQAPLMFLAGISLLSLALLPAMIGFVVRIVLDD